MKNFVKLKNGGYKDKITKLVWFPTDFIGTQPNAMKLKSKTKRLPTIGELRLAYEHGISKAIPEFKDRWYWSSSPNPGKPFNSYFLYGDNGEVSFYLHNFDYGSAILVSK